MKKLALILSIITLAAGSAQASCYADYKAKRDNPLRLHYGVIELPDAVCSDMNAASAEIARRVGAGGWTFLNVLSIFDASGLKEREASAGQFYLRF